MAGSAPHRIRDRLRFSLTCEAGLNDGTAFPFVMLGLGLLGLHDVGEWGWRWFAVDVIWSVLGGLGIGAVLGTLVGQLVLYLRRERKEAFGLDEFLTLGVDWYLLRPGRTRACLWFSIRLRRWPGLAHGREKVFRCKIARSAIVHRS